MTKSLRKISDKTEDRTRDLLNTSRTAHPTDLAGLAANEETICGHFTNHYLRDAEHV